MLKWAVFPKPAEFRRRIVGSDPRAATCRGKLQSKRSKLNMEINKELMLRSGAENLFKASTDRKTKETVALELSFVNSNLQLLKEQLAELNSSVEVYQAEQAGHQPTVPMIPLGLKETKELELEEVFRELIESHYYEDGADYDEALAELTDLRQAMRTPTRDRNGTALLFQYYNQLYFVERRFFPPDRSSGLHFEWYDSLTGVPCTQKTVAFERASVLFNIGGLYTQMGTRHNRSTAEGLENAVDNFLRAAGTFQYILENFSHAPSRDLEPATLHMLVQLMCGQARECLYEKAALVGGEEQLVLAQEAAHLSQAYHQVLVAMQQAQDYVPFSWLSLVQVKREHFRALADQHVAQCLLSSAELSSRSLDLLHYLHDCAEVTEAERPEVPTSRHQRKYLGKAHLREALLAHEEALRVNRMCRELRKKDALQEVLKESHQKALHLYEEVDEEDDFQELLEPPPVLPATSIQLTLSFPDFSAHRVSDLFQQLGPEAVFSAKHHWTAPRSIQLRKHRSEGFGFSVRGDAPVVLVGVEQSSLAMIAGLKEGDYLVAIGDRDVKWEGHDTVVSLIRQAGDFLRLRVVSPLDSRVARAKAETAYRLSPPSLRTTSSSTLSSHPSSSSSTSSSPTSSTGGSTRAKASAWSVLRIQ